MDPRQQNVSGQPGYNSNLQPGQPGYNANMQPGVTSSQQPGQSLLSKVENTIFPGGRKTDERVATALENQPGLSSGMQPGQPGYSSSMQSGQSGLSSGMQPGLSSNLQPGQSGYSSSMQPGLSSNLQPGQPGYSSSMQPGQSGLSSNLQPGQSGYSSNLQPGQSGLSSSMQPGHSGLSSGMQPGLSSSMQPGQSGYNSNLQPGQPGYSSSMQSGQSGLSSNLQPGQSGYNSNLQPGQPGYNSNLQPGQLGYQPPGQGVSQSVSQSAHHAFGQTPMPGNAGYVAGQPLLPGQSSSSSSSSQQPGMMPAGYASYGPPSNVGYGRPTIMPTPNFNPNMEAERIRSAIKGSGTSDSTIIDIFGSRTSMELKQIDACYKTMFGSMMMKDLENELKLSGSFMKILNYRFFTLAEFDAHNVHKSVTGPRTDENALIEIFTTRNNQQIREAVEAYRRMFNRDLEKDVVSDLSGNFKNLMTSLIQGNRDETGRLDQSAAVADANNIYNSGQGRWGTDDLTLNNIFVTRSYPQLNLIFNEYSKISKYDIEQSIDKELSGNFKLAMMSIIKSARDRPGFFAERLYNSMKGLGSDERTLNRIIVSRCEIDLEDIKQSYNTKFNKDLNKVVEGDTKGDYQRILLQILGNFRTTPTY